jgi:hypothetical protein
MGTAPRRSSGTLPARSQRPYAAGQHRTGDRTRHADPHVGAGGAWTDAGPCRWRTTTPTLSRAEGSPILSRAAPGLAWFGVRGLIGPASGMDVPRLSLGDHQPPGTSGPAPFERRRRLQPAILLPAWPGRSFPRGLRSPGIRCRDRLRRCSNTMHPKRRHRRSGASRSRVAAAWRARCSSPRLIAFCKRLMPTQGETGRGLGRGGVPCWAMASESWSRASARMSGAFVPPP